MNPTRYTLRAVAVLFLSLSSAVAQLPLTGPALLAQREAATSALRRGDQIRAHALLVPLCRQAEGWACHNLGSLEYSFGQIGSTRQNKDVAFAKAYLFFTAAERLGFESSIGEGPKMKRLVSDPAAIVRADQLLVDLTRAQNAFKAGSGSRVDQ